MDGLSAERAARLAAALRDALARHRSPDELYDVTCAVLRHHLGEEALVSIYVAEHGRLWLHAQRGYAQVVHSFPLDTAVASLALRARETVHIRDHARDHPLYIDAVDRIEGEIVVPFESAGATAVLILESRLPAEDWLVPVLESAVAALAEALDGLEPADWERAAVPHRLTHAFLGIAGMRDREALLELTARSVGETLGLDCVQITERVDSQVTLATTWMRVLDHSLALDAATVERIAALCNHEYMRVHGSEGAASAPVRELRGRGVSELVGLPLAWAGERLGYLIGLGLGGPAISDAAFEQAELLVAHASTALGNLQAFERKAHEAATDALTGLFNHRRFHEAGAELIQTSPSDGFALVLSDLDDFKELNDRRGHVAGDDALQVLARLLLRGMRPADNVFRLGGEEFALLLPGTSKANARTVCRRLQRALAATDFDGWRLTLSFGIARWPQDGDNLRDLMSAADAALYEAKRLGKDRITYADERLVARRSPSMAARARRPFEQMRQLQELTRGLAATRTPQDVASTVLAVLAGTIPHDHASVWGIDGGRLVTPPLAQTINPAHNGNGDDLLADIASEAIEAGRSRLRDDRFDAAGEPVSLLAAPLEGEHMMVGAIALGASQLGGFDRDDLRLLEVMSHVAGLVFENALLFDEARREQALTRGLLELGRRLAECESPEAVGEVIAAAVVSRIACDRTSLWLYERNGYCTLAGVDGPAAGELLAMRPYTYRPDTTCRVERELLQGLVVTTTGAEHPGLPELTYPAELQIAEFPLMYEGGLLGSLNVMRMHGPPFTEAEKQALEGITGQAGLALRAQRSYQEVEAGFLATIESLVQALDAKDAYTSSHALAIIDLVVAVGRQLGLEAPALRDLEHAAMLHDIGKIGVPAEIIRKAGPLDRQEMELMRRHPEVGARILEPVPRLGRIAPIVRHSHERWDGRGYPDGIAGDQIPLEARIVAVCDAFHAMISDRPYQAARTVDDALDELERNAGSQFDARVVEAFVGVVREPPLREAAA